LALITQAYTALLDAWDRARAAGKLKDDPPVLVLDEANVLMAWGDQYKEERQTLLRFFVAITKARQRSHVILATSEYCLSELAEQRYSNNTPAPTHRWQHSPFSNFASTSRSTACWLVQACQTYF